VYKKNSEALDLGSYRALWSIYWKV